MALCEPNLGRTSDISYTVMMSLWRNCCLFTARGQLEAPRWKSTSNPRAFGAKFSL